MFDATAMSPMSRFLTGWDNHKGGVIFHVRGLKPLMTWWASLGFPKVSEGTLKSLCDEFDLEVSTADIVEGQTMKEAMRLVLTAWFLPDLTESEALKIFLAAAHDEDEKGQNLLDYMDEELLRDVVLLGDQAVCKEFVEERKEALSKRQQQKVTIQTFASTKFGSLAAKATKGRETQAARKKAAAKLAAEQSKWRAALVQAPGECIMNSKPCSASVCTDLMNGRYQIGHPTYGRRSFSWTQRGHESAIHLALQTMWQWHFDQTGEAPLGEYGLDGK